MRKLTPSENYAKARKRLGMSHRDVGQLLGVQHTTCARWESGESEPPLYVSALMAALRADAMDVETLRSWMDHARRILVD